MFPGKAPDPHLQEGYRPPTPSPIGALQRFEYPPQRWTLWIRHCSMLDSHIPGVMAHWSENIDVFIWRWEPDRRSNFFFSPTAHLCAVMYITEISLDVTLNNQFLSQSPSVHMVQWECTYCGKCYARVNLFTLAIFVVSLTNMMAIKSEIYITE